MERHPARSLCCALAVVTLVFLNASGCGTSGRPPGTSGFLQDYSKLAPGRGNQAQLVYLHAEADFSAYDAIIVDPIAVWNASEGRLVSDPPESFSRQSRYFEKALREHLADVYRVVEAPEPGTLRLRMAIVEGLATGVGIECELTDSKSSERLIAAVDRRERSTSTQGTDPTDAAERAYDRWAEIIRDRLVALRNFDASQREAGDAGD